MDWLTRAFIPTGNTSVPEQLNIKAVTGACKLIDGCNLKQSCVWPHLQYYDIIGSGICHKNTVNSTPSDLDAQERLTKERPTCSSDHYRRLFFCARSARSYVPSKTIGSNRSFSYCAPVAWNRLHILSDGLGDPHISLASFKKQLKPFLFKNGDVLLHPSKWTHHKFCTWN